MFGAFAVAGLAFQVMADVAQRVVGAFVDHLQIARHALGLAAVVDQQVAGEQHAGQRILEIVRDQVDQFLALARDPFQAVAGELEADVGVDPRQQFFGQERLGDVIDHAGVERAQQQVAVVGGGDEHHRHAQRRVGAQRVHDFETVHARHHHVEQDQVGRGLRIQLQSLVAGRGGHHLVTLAGQQGGHHAQIRGLVVDDQDATGGCRGSAHVL